MTALNTWFAAAASNTAPSPNGFPEDMLPSGLNNSFREVMAAITLGTPIWFDSVSDMRAITVNPGSTKRFALLENSLLVPTAWYQWLDTRTGTDNGITIISPTASTLTAGAFEQVAYRKATGAIDYGTGGTVTLSTGVSRPAFFNASSNVGFDTTIIGFVGNYLGEAYIVAPVSETIKVLTNNLVNSNRTVHLRPPVGSILRVMSSGNPGNASVLYSLCGASPYVSATAAIVTGVLTLSGDTTGRNTFIKFVETQGGAATDSLDTITLLTGTAITGSRLILKAVNDAHTVVVTNLGNIDLNGSVAFTLDSQYDTMMLVYGSSTSRWKQVMASNNGA